MNEWCCIDSRRVFREWNSDRSCTEPVQLNRVWRSMELEKLGDLEERVVHAVRDDVMDEQSRRQCVDTVIKREDLSDVLVNNAGNGSFGSPVNVPVDEAKCQHEANIFGLGG